MYEYSKSTRNYRQDSLTNIWTHFIRRLDKIPLPRWFCSSGPMDRWGGAPRPNDRRWEDPSSWRVIERLKLHLFWCSDFNNNTDMFVQTKPVWHWHKTLTSCTEKTGFGMWFLTSLTATRFSRLLEMLDSCPISHLKDKDKDYLSSNKVLNSWGIRKIVKMHLKTIGDPPEILFVQSNL